DPQIQHSQLDNWAADLRPRLPTAERFSASGVTEYLAGNSAHRGLMSANFTTLPHFSVSSAMSLPKLPGEPGSAVEPNSASRVCMLGSARAALISWLSLSTISMGVLRGAPMPVQKLNS